MAQGNVVDRFIDAGKEPTKTLTPITGYEKSDLVSLEQAVTEIKPSIDNLDAMIWAAKRNCEDPLDGLSSDESASIHLYTMEWPEGHSFYTLLNERLRSEKRNELKSWFSYLKLFFTALYKLPSLKQIVWRGIRGDVSHLYRKDYIWWGVSSCTDTMEVMQKFVGRSGVRTLFMIECINGKSIQSHSFYRDENEIILMPGTYLRVIDKWSPADDLYVIRLQEEIPPFKLVASPFDASSPINNIPLQKLTIAKPSQPSKSIISTSLLSSPPTYKNTKLEQKINENKDKSLLHLNELSLTDADMEIVSYYLLRNNKTLTYLNLSSNLIGDQGVQYLGEALQNNATLGKLVLGNNQIGAQGAQYLGEALQQNITLKSLFLDKNQIGDQGTQYLGDGLQKNTTLTKLHLNANQIGDQGAQYLSEALQKNKTLTYLYLAHNQIGVQGAQYLGQSFQNNTTLNTLNIDTNQIGDRGAQYLSEALQKIKTLTYLYLSKNQIGDKGAQYLEKLKKSNRKINVFW